MLHQHLTAEPPAVGAIRVGIPTGVAAAARRALAKAPADRFATAREFAEALASPSTTVAEAIARPRRRASIAAGWVLVAVSMAVVAGVAMRARGRASAVIAPAATLAVIPFAPATADTALFRLGRELAITLTSNLDGVGGIRAVDALTVLAQASDPNAAYSLERGAALARRLGARSLIHGSLLRLGPNVRLDLALFDSDSLSPIARASVMAPPEDITALTDSATWALLHQVWQRGEPQSPSLAAVTTRSVPALRAFLEGERWFAAAEWGPAAREYGRAIEADSTFWLAYWRYAYVKEVWLSEPVDTAIQSAFRAHLSAFPERDRLLIAATRTENTTAAIGLMQTVTERFPNYWPGWWSYADMLVHVTPLLGTGYADARDALDRVVALNPDLVVGWNHLFWIAELQRDTAATAHALRELARLAYHGAQPYVHLQYLDRLLRTGGVPEATFTDSVARLVAAYRPPRDPVGGASMFGFPRAEVDVARRVLSLRPPADIAAMQRLNLALAWAQRGAWDSALVAARDYLQSSPGRDAALYGYRLAVMGAWLGALDSAVVAGWRAIAARFMEESPPEGRAEVAWLDGVVAVVQRKRPDLVAARQALQRSGAQSTPILDRSLAALELELVGDRRRATDALVRLEIESAERWWAPLQGRSVGCDHPYVNAIDRLTAARWLASASDLARAAQLLRWNEAVFPRSCGVADPVERTLSPIASLEQGRVEDA
ncbi:MAG TPA: hypothetical protein VFD68_05440, partial [Gemmatimonadales bacterium]|nr:hypothetical protein [Gemmatimonadales bacterium]